MPENMIELARAERADLAELLAQLRPEQWETPSLCEGWRVHDVVAHMLSYDELGTREVLRRFAKAGFSLKRANAIGLDEYRTRSPEELLSLLRKYLRPRGLTTMFGGMIAFLDCTIHQQDIRRPLGMPRDIPAQRLRRALPAAFSAPPLGVRQRTKGLRLVATDIDWTSGSGEEVRGNAEPLLMAMAGRHGVIQELTGPGTRILAGRIGQPG